MTFAQFIGDGNSGIIGAINSAIVPVIFAFAFAAFIWGVMKYFFVNPAGKESFGERGGYGEGRQFVLWGILGMVVLFSVWALVNMLLSTLGIAPAGR